LHHGDTSTPTTTIFAKCSIDAALMTGIHDHLCQCTVDFKTEIMADQQESKDVLSEEDGSDEDVV
jgi:hypothetical protein